MAPHDVKHDAVAGVHHAGLKEGSAKSRIARILDSQWIEAFILFLVFVDIGLLSMEAGIDHHMLCIDGHVVPRPAGLPASHHAFMQIAAAPLGWAIAPMNDGAGVDTSSQAIPDISPAVNLKARLQGTIHHVKHKRAVGADVTDDPEGLEVIKDIHSSSGDDDKKHHGREHKEVSHHEHAAHPEGKTHSEGEHHGTGKAHGEHGGHGHGTNEVLMCETRHGHHSHHISHSCHQASIVILVIFLIEISLKFWVNPSGFCKNWFLIIDAVVIIVSLITDTLISWWVETYKPEKQSDVAAIAAALLFVRCWRIIRIAHGLAEHLHAANEEKEEMAETTEKAKELEEELRKTKQELRAARGS